MSARDFFTVVGRRRRRSSVIYLFRHRDGPVKKIKFSPFFKNKQSFQNSRLLGQNECTRFFRLRRSSPSSVVRHFPLSSQGRTCEKNQIFACFSQYKQSFQNSRLLGKMSAQDFFAVVGRRRRRSSVIYLFRHRDGPVKKIKFSPFFKNKQSFQNSRFLGKMSVRVFFGFVGRRRRRSSVISLFRHRDGPVKKIKFSPFFKNKQSFQNSRFLGKMSARDFFAVVGRRRRRSSVIYLFRHRDGPVKKIKFSPFFKNKQSFQNSRFLGKMSVRHEIFSQKQAIRRSSPSSVVRHFPLSSQGRTCEKNQIFAVFQKQAIFPKFKIFRQNECTRFFRRRRSSPSSVVRHFPLSSQGRTCEKNQIFAVFQKQAIFPKFKIFRQNECTRFFRRRQLSVISLFRHRDGPVKKIKFSPFFKNKQSFQNSRFLGKMSARDFFAVVGRRRRRSSVIYLFRHRDGPVKKIKFSPFFKNKQSFQNSRFLGKMSARDFFAVGRRRRSVISLFRHRDGPVKKIKFSPFFKNKQSFQNSRFLGKMSARDFFAVVGCRRRRSSVIYLFRHRDGPVKKIKFSPFFKNKQSFQNSRFLGKMSVRVFFGFVGRRRRRSSVISLFRHRDGPVKKIKFSPFFKNKQSFQNSRLLGKMSARDFFAVVGRRRPSSVISLFRHRDGPVKKIKFSPVFQKQAIFPKFKIFRKNECTRFFRRRQSVISLFRQRDGPVKKIKFSPSKTSNLSKIQDF